MQPSEFWGTDTWSVIDAHEGYLMSKGVKVGGTKLTRTEIEELQELIREGEQ